MNRVLVVGDVIADVYRDCSFKKMCPDADDVRAIVQDKIDVRPGGAANVALNIAALSPDTAVYLIGDLSTEVASEIKRLSKGRVNLAYASHSDDPLKKERIILDDEFILRVDNKSFIDDATLSSIEKNLEDFLADFEPDLVVISDYGAGTITPSVLDTLLKMRHKLLVDTKMTDLSVFAEGGERTALIKLNHDEWKEVVKSEAVPERFFKAMVVTKGSDGADLIIHRGGLESYEVHKLHVHAHPVCAVDVCGCGDTFLAGLAASLLESSDEFTAVQFANAASATVVSRPRTAVADLARTLDFMGVNDEARR